MARDSIRVLHVGLSANMGGIENVVRSWNSLLPNNIKFDFINNGSGLLAYQGEFVDKGAKIYDIVPRNKNPWKSYRQLRQIIIENQYDYIHHHMMSYSWTEPLLLAQQIGSTKAIAHSHCVGAENLDLKYRILDHIGRKRLERREYYKIACGNAAGLDMFRTDNFVVIKNGVEFSKCQFSEMNRLLIRHQYLIPDGTFVVGHVGRSGIEKNYPFIIQLFCDLLKQRADTVLMLIGNVNDDISIQKLVHEKGIQDRVIFTGVIPDLKMYYSAMDVFILPSLSEGVSVAQLEAQVSGLECLVSEFVSSDADISGNVNYISVSDTRDWVEKLMRINNHNRDISSLNIDYSYDLKETAQNMFGFYEAHM